MADDIVTRLRTTDYEYEDAELAFDAADEIERLRAAGDHLVRLIFSSTIPSIDSLMDYLRSGIDDWEEARRG